MSRKHNLLNLIDNIKQKITDKEYKDLVENLYSEEKKEITRIDKTYLTTGFYTYLEPTYDDEECNMTLKVKIRLVNDPVVFKLEQEFLFSRLLAKIESDGFVSLENRINSFVKAFDHKDVIMEAGTFYATKIWAIG